MKEKEEMVLPFVDDPAFTAARTARKPRAAKAAPAASVTDGWRAAAERATRAREFAETGIANIEDAAELSATAAEDFLSGDRLRAAARNMADERMEWLAAACSVLSALLVPTPCALCGRT